MRTRRVPLASLVVLAAAIGGCRGTAGPAPTPLRFDARPVPAERSAIYPVTAARAGAEVVVRGGFFVGAPAEALTARVVATAVDATLLEVGVAPAAGAAADAAMHFDYEAVLPAAGARELTVVHLRPGATRADTVFRGRVY
jgi:hypothetical protein